MLWLLAPVLASAAVWVFYGLRAATRDTSVLHRRLDATERALRHATVGAPCGILTLDAEQRIVSANPSAAALVGVPGRSLAGARLEDLIRPIGDGQRVSWVSTSSTELAFEASDGTVRSVRARRQWLDEARGRSRGSILFLEDVTAFGEAKARLQIAEERFRQIIEEAPDGVAVCRDGRFSYVNRALVSILGCESERALLGCRPSRFAAGEPGQDRFSQRIRVIGRSSVAEPIEPGSSLTGRFEAMLAGEPTPERWQQRFLRADGGEVLAEVSAIRTVFDGAPAVLLLVRDVTEREAMQSRLLAAERMASLGTLAAGVAHDINNPLAYVAANLTFVLERLPSDAPVPGGSREEIVEAVREAREGVDRVALIVRGLKTFSRPDEAACGPVDVRRVLDAAVNMARSEIRHRAHLVKDYAETSPVLADEVRLGQIVLNLLVNAAQAMPDGNAARNTIRLGVRALPGGEVAIDVEDTAGGIPPGIVGRIFDPFFTTKAVGVGTGLGLAICKGLVEKMAGRITLENRPGSGATFRVILPAADAVGAASHAAPPADEPAIRQRILVVDDEPALGRALKRLLAGDHDVAVAMSGREALDRLLGGEHHDIILCDLMMPEVTGMDVHAELAALAPGLEERMIFMTGGAFAPSAREFLGRVPNPRCDKPLSLEQLRPLIASMAQPKNGRPGLPGQA